MSICDATNFSDDVLKSHYQDYHSINENDYFFRELFSSDSVLQRCDECKLEFKRCRLKKNYNFLLRRGSIFYYYINFCQHKNFYDFYDEKTVDSFLNSVYERFVPSKDSEICGTYQLPAEQNS